MGERSRAVGGRRAVDSGQMGGGRRAAGVGGRASSVERTAGERPLPWRRKGELWRRHKATAASTGGAFKAAITIMRQVSSHRRLIARLDCSKGHPSHPLLPTYSSLASTALIDHCLKPSLSLLLPVPTLRHTSHSAQRHRG